ncbi:MAG: UDP-3-O-(3-hydroxymyristoyl)glucosamine N-acyltransferase [Deltaproteobacteria bacterium]|nr:UDP-3-O-(3-hydroxymyristoyl)glucosamine N-acyltransferase [Deltaproteobacteria bacterium]
MERSLESLARDVGGRVSGDGSVLISGLAGIEVANKGDITFVRNEKYTPLLKKTKASAAIVAEEIPDTEIPLLIASNPLLAMAKILAFFTQGSSVRGGSSDQAWISPSAKVSKDAAISPFVSIGDEAQIGSRVTIYSGSSIGPQAVIGDDTVIYPNVTIYRRCVLGRRVIVHAGAVIGADGFGFVKDGETNVRIPQVGIVEIEDDVEIGANCCIDRATFGKTLIKKGVKIDNLVQVAHNVQVGEHSIIVAQVGISGSTTVGKNVTLAGQVGLVDHIQIGDNVMVGAQSGITKDVPANQIVLGSPHLPHRQFLRVASVWSKLPELKKELDFLLKRVEALEKGSQKK